jgi:hypothetical protein
MAIANPQWIGIAHGRHAYDLPRFFRANNRPFIYFRENPTATGTWFGCGSAGVEVTTAITDPNDINGALQAAAASALV